MINYPEFAPEIQLIGSILIEPEYFIYAADLDVNDFGNIDLASIFNAVKYLYRRGKEINLVNLNYLLKNEKRLNDIVQEIIAQTSLSIGKEQIENCVSLIKINACKRRIKAKLPELEKTVDNAFTEEEYSKLCEEMDNFNKLKYGMFEAEGVTMAEGMKLIAENKTRRYMKTGYGMVDYHIHIDRGDYILIGGRPSAGKTSFALNIAVEMSKKYKVGFFSLETSAKKIYERTAAFINAQPLSEIMDGDVRPVETQKYNLTVIDKPMSVDKIEAAAIKGGFDVIFIDYLGLITDTAKTRYEKITNISVGLHNLAQSAKITVFALSQLGRLKGDTPTMESLRESGQLEQDADAIILLSKCGDEPEDEDIASVAADIVKNKTGQCGSVRFKFYKKTQMFKES